VSLRCSGSPNKNQNQNQKGKDMDKFIKALEKTVDLLTMLAAAFCLFLIPALILIYISA
jgi:hypothetical protein